MSLMKQFVGLSYTLILLITICQTTDQNRKHFQPVYSQQIQTQSHILSASDTTISIFDPNRLMIGVLGIGNTNTSKFVSLNAGVVGNGQYVMDNFVRDNIVYNLEGMMGASNREQFTTISDQFYHSTRIAYTQPPYKWYVISSGYIMNLYKDSTLWLTHSKNIRYLLIGNLSQIMGISSIVILQDLINIQASNIQQIFIFLKTSIWQFKWDWNIEQYQHKTIPMDSQMMVGTTGGYRISTDGTYIFVWGLGNINGTSSNPTGNWIKKYKIRADQYQSPYFQLEESTYLETSTNTSIQKIQFCENNINYLLTFSNSSFRICGFLPNNFINSTVWSINNPCYHILGMPSNQIKSSDQADQYQVREFYYKNLTHFYTMTKTNNFTIYKTNQFLNDYRYTSNQQWPMGIINSDPLSQTKYNIIQSTSTIYSYSNEPKQDPFQPSQQSSQDLQQSYSIFSKSPSTSTLVTLLSIPNGRKLFAFFNPLYIVLEDFWFYAYMDINFSSAVNRRLNIIRKINQQKILPRFFYTITQELKKHLSMQLVFPSPQYPMPSRSQSQLSTPKFVQLQNAPSYFMLNCQDVLIWNTLYQIAMILLYKLMLKIPLPYPMLLRRKLQALSIGLGLMLTVVQDNVIMIGFMGFSQIRAIGCFGLKDNLNMIIMYIAIFIVLTYCLVGVPMLHTHPKWQILTQRITKSHKSRLRSCRSSSSFALPTVFLQSLQLLVGKFLFSLIIGFCQYKSIQTLKWVMILIDLALIFITLIGWLCMQEGISGFIGLFYLFVKTGFDISLFYYTRQTSNFQLRDQIFIAVLAIITLYGIFWKIFLLYEQNFNKKYNATAKIHKPVSSQIKYASKYQIVTNNFLSQDNLNKSVLTLQNTESNINGTNSRILVSKKVNFKANINDEQTCNQLEKLQRCISSSKNHRAKLIKTMVRIENEQNLNVKTKKRFEKQGQIQKQRTGNRDQKKIRRNRIRKLSIQQKEKTTLQQAQNFHKAELLQNKKSINEQNCKQNKYEKKAIKQLTILQQNGEQQLSVSVQLIETNQQKKEQHQIENKNQLKNQIEADLQTNLIKTGNILSIRGKIANKNREEPTKTNKQQVSVNSENEFDIIESQTTKKLMKISSQKQ